MTSTVHFYKGRDAILMLEAIDAGADTIRDILGPYVFVCYDEEEEEFVYLDNRSEVPKVYHYLSFDEVAADLCQMT